MIAMRLQCAEDALRAVVADNVFSEVMPDDFDGIFNEYQSAHQDAEMIYPKARYYDVTNYIPGKVSKYAEYEMDDEISDYKMAEMQACFFDGDHYDDGC